MIKVSFIYVYLQHTLFFFFQKLLSTSFNNGLVLVSHDWNPN